MPALHFINSRLPNGELTELRVLNGVIAELGARPQDDERVIDLGGDRLLPGLINAHDHLQLNSLPALEPGVRYENARQWIEGVEARRRTDGDFKVRAAHPRDERLLMGGVKNLLSGVTTVAHHDPYYPALGASGFPVSVLSRYGWAHSLHVDGEAAVRRSFLDTPASLPWLIHAAEGIDAEAAAEFARLERLGCIAANTLLIHGVALGAAERARLGAAGGGLIWCPSSNLNLFGRTAQAAELMEAGRVALGSDSRLSGARDLLTEMALAHELGVRADGLARLVGADAARLLRLSDRGELGVGLRADLVVLPAARPLGYAQRADVRLVLIGGEARYGDADLVRASSPASDIREVIVDGVRKVLPRALVETLGGMVLREAGLEGCYERRDWRVA